MSSDKTKDIIEDYKRKSKFKEFKTVTKAHKNIADGWNKILPYAKGEFIALISPDMILPKNWANNLLRHFKDETVGGVGPVVRAYYTKPHILMNFWNCFEFSKKVTEWSTLDATACIFRKKSIPKKFDDNLFRNEDCNFTLDVRENKYKLLNDPSVIVLHYHEKGIKDELLRFYMYGLTFPEIVFRHKGIYPISKFLREVVLSSSIPISIFLFILFHNTIWVLMLSLLVNFMYYFVRMKKEFKALPCILFGILSNLFKGIGYMVGLFRCAIFKLTKIKSKI